MFKSNRCEPMAGDDFMTGFKDGFEIGTKLVMDFISTGKKCQLIKRDNLPKKIYDDLMELRRDHAVMKKFFKGNDIPFDTMEIEETITEFKEDEPV